MSAEPCLAVLFLLPADEAAIYQEIDTGTERRGLTGEKDGGANHLVDWGDPPQRCIGSKCFELLGHFRTLVHRCEGIPRTDAIHPNPAVTPFHRETFREMDHRSFRAIVMRLGEAAIDNDPRHRGNVDDRAA